MKPYLFPYNINSEAARELARALRCLRVRSDGNYKPKQNHLVVNYGNSRAPAWMNNDCRVLNRCEAVQMATNKRSSLEVFGNNGVRCPVSTTDRAVANGWANQRIPFLARMVLNGSGGEGIIVVDDTFEEENIPVAPLYVQYVKKSREFRIHVFMGRVIFQQEKKKRAEATVVNWKIRNLANGFVFCHNDLEDIPVAVNEEAIKAVDSLGLDFGAVDVVWNNYQQAAYVLEVNTAPGLQGETVNAYANAISEYAK